MDLDVELITFELQNSDQLNYAIEKVPVDADALFLLPDSLLHTRILDFTAAAERLKLPTSAPNTETVARQGALTSFGSDLISMGKQAARLADQIFQGVKPADLPIETSEFFLAINLRVAKAIGLEIPDEILRQADIIIR
jgi:putative ABC transport system substrate-binding protein